MSRNSRCSEKMILACGIIFAGLLIGSLFVRFSSAELILQTGERMSRSLTLSSFRSFAERTGREITFLLLCVLMSRTPKRAGAFLILFYKGFCVGVAAAVICRLFGAAGMIRIVLFILPQNIIYLFVLSLAVFYSSADMIRGAHDRSVKSVRPAFYVLILFLIILGALIETLVQPWIYKMFF